jgi:photosystem II stability/assembly factor-like uncharacterized protein
MRRQIQILMWSLLVMALLVGAAALESSLEPKTRTGAFETAIPPGPGLPESEPASSGSAAAGAGTDEEVPGKGPDLARWYFEQWHYPAPGILPVAETDRIWSEIEAMPDESEAGGRAVNGWECIGPYGQANGDGGQFTGRVLDIEAERSPGLRVAAASGGLWEFLFLVPVPRTDDIQSQWLATFCTHPSDENTILVGTGEPSVSSGRGLWKKTSGTGWVHKPMSPEPSAFYRVRYAPNGNTVHAATYNGYYRSTDGGETWTRTFTGRTTDLAIHPASPNILYVTVWGSGLYKSTDAGVTWAQVTTPGIPTSGVTRGAVAISATPTPVRIYVAFAGNDYRLQGVYKSNNGQGGSWTNVSPPEEYMWGQGWYNNMVGVSPTNNNLVLVGGGGMWRSADGGITWTEPPSYGHLHVDYHACTWHSDGNQVWVGHDGGWSYSGDAGLTWDSAGNYQPITQFVNIHPAMTDMNLIGGGSQDNGIAITEDGGSHWYHRNGGDGGGFTVDPGNSNNLYMVNGVYGGDLAFRRYRSTNKGVDWQDINNGLDPSTMWYPRIRTDFVSPPWLYTNSDRFVYRSTNLGTNWTKVNASPFPVRVHELTATQYVPPNGSFLYACSPTLTAGQKLFVYENGVWYERSATLPSGVWIRKVAVHPSNPSRVYAIMNGVGTPGQKVYRSNDRGNTWTNITGDLPDQPLSDVITHPTDPNILYLGSEFGCFRTTDNGAHWHRWNNGMPEAAIVTEMGYIDLRSQYGQYWIIAGTYGRGIWKREISGDDPASAEVVPPTRYELRQNYPNPVVDRTTIEFSLPNTEPVALRVFDASGRQVAELLNGKRPAGVHRVDFDASELAAGAYFYKFTSSRGTEAKKMVVYR